MPDAPRAALPIGDRLGFDVADSAARLGISRAQMYRLIAAREIESFKIGSRRVVPASAIDQYIVRKLAEARSETA